MESNTNITNQSCNIYIYTELAQVIFPIFYILVFLFSVCGNSLVLYVTWQQQHKFNSTSVYLLNLALSDTLFTLALPGRITYYIRGFDWPFGDFTCRLTALVFYANTYAGIAFMTCISLDRYLAMVHPHRLTHLRKLPAVRVISAVVWLLVLLENSPLLFRSTLTENAGRRACMEYSSLDDSPVLPYLVLLGCMVNYVAPLVVILACYTQVRRKLSRAAKESLATVRSTRGHKANSIILLILAAFVLCFSPYHVNIAQIVVRRLIRRPSCEEMRAFKMSLQVTVSLMNLNCCLDPLIYFFAIRTYKQRVKSLLRSLQLTSGPTSSTAAENSSSNT
ncbi:hypothetical protein GJAV_G00212500 [Gymnothorax javanicus]|nr:hypothetical protein GJAV_G00212500 [Gymnothorax javanicus]